MTALKKNSVEFLTKCVMDRYDLGYYSGCDGGIGDIRWDIFKNVSWARPELRRLFKQMSFGYIIFVVIKQNYSTSRTDTAELALHVLFSLWFV